MDIVDLSAIFGSPLNWSFTVQEQKKSIFFPRFSRQKGAFLSFSRKKVNVRKIPGIVMALLLYKGTMLLGFL